MKRITGGAIAAGALVLALGWGATTVSAQDKAAVVKDRQETMKAQGAAMGTIKKYIDGEADQAAAAKSVDDLVKINPTLPSKFPKDTGRAQVPDSYAKPEIWTDNDKFVAAWKNLGVQVDKLAVAVKSGDKKAAADQFAATGKEGCGGCHTPFRIPKT
jgi:cytochrome c556